MPIVLSIGDGGNDVPMIQAAHVGIGIQGREGLQAALASDYSVTQFSHLRNLLFVHGRSSYRRIAYITLFSMYKSVILAFSQGVYALFTGFSGINFYDSMQLTLYNIVYTGLPIFFYLFDRDVPATVALSTPRLYQQGQQGKLFNWKQFFWWECKGMFQGLVLMLLNYGIFSGTQTPTPQVAFMTYTAVLVVHTATLVGDSHTLTWINHLFIWGCFIILLPITAVTSAISSSYSGVGVFVGCLSDPLFYALIFLYAVLLCTPIWVIGAVKDRHYFRNVSVENVMKRFHLKRHTQ